MYSGGFAYFDEIFKGFRQQSSYFAFQNAHWLLLCVDTAYVDHDIDAQQAAWLNAVVGNAGMRKIVMFSHHQLFSSIGSQGPNLATALARLLSRRAITAWYWGHEHECIIYDRHASSGLHAASATAVFLLRANHRSLARRRSGPSPQFNGNVSARPATVRPRWCWMGRTRTSKARKTDLGRMATPPSSSTVLS